MNPVELKVYVALAIHVNAHTGVAFPKRGTLAELCSVSIRTIDRALSSLESAGWIVKRERYTEHGDRDSNEYEVRFVEPEGVASQVTLPLVTADATGGVTADAPLTGQGLTGSSGSKDPSPRVEQTRPFAARPRDEVWDALVAAFWEPATDAERKRVGKVVRSLKQAGASGAEVRRRCGAWDSHWRPDGKGSSPTLTPEALVKHWTALGQTAGPAARIYTAAEIAAMEAEGERKQAEQRKMLDDHYGRTA